MTDPTDTAQADVERFLKEDQQEDRELYEYATGIAASKQIERAHATGRAEGIEAAETSRDKHGFKKISPVWDESCMLHAVLVDEKPEEPPRADDEDGAL